MSEIAIKLSLNPELDVAKMNAFLNAMKAALGPLGKEVNPIDAKKLDAELAKIGVDSARAAQEIKKMGTSFSEVEQRASGMNKAFNFNQMSQVIQGVANSMQEVIAVGAEFEANLAALGAITGFSGDQLGALGERARALAKEFGGSASDQLKSFQGILSKLGPQVADNAEALGKLATNVNTLSAASGDDAATSMNAIVDSMLQFGLVTGDAAKDAETSTRIINGLAASAQVGAAEIPQVAAAILQTGVAAKGANLSFEAVNAAIQTLAVGGKTGSEAGVALRNVLGLIQKASGPAEAAMNSMGTSSKELGKLLTEQGLGAALAKLKTGMQGLASDAERNVAMFTIFGTENAAGAGILLDNLDLMQQFQDGIEAGQQGTGAAFEQAAVRMNTVQTTMARVKAFVQDQYISMTQVIGQSFTSLLGSVASLAPQLTALAGVKQIIPESLVEQFSEKGGKLFSALAAGGKSQIATVGGAIAKDWAGVFEKLNVNPDTFSKLTSTLTGEAGKIGGKLLEMGGKVGNGIGAIGKFAFGPWGIAIAGAIAVLVLLYNKVEPFRALVDRVFGYAIEIFEQISPLISQIGDVLGVVGTLIAELFVTQFELVGDILSGIFSIVGGLFGVTADGATSFEMLGKAVEFISQRLSEFKAMIEGTTAFIKSLKDSFGDVIEKFAAGDMVGAIKAIGSAGSEAGKAMKDGMVNSLQDSAFKNSADKVAKAMAESLKIKAKIEAADSVPDLTKSLEETQAKLKPLQIKAEAGKLTDAETAQYDILVKKAQSVSDKIKQIAPEAAGGFTTMKNTAGELVQVVDINIAKANELAEAQKKSAGSDLKTQQDAFSASLQGQISIYEQQKGKLKEIEAAAIAAGKAGKTDEAKQKIAEYEALKKKVVENGDTIRKTFAEGAKTNLSIGTAKLSDTAKQEFAGELKILETQARDAKIGEAVSDAMKLKGKIDEQGQIQKLVADLANAKTEAEKNSISAAIAAKMPEAIAQTKLAVGANGELVKTFEINSQKALESAEANKQRFSGDLLAKQQQYQSALNSEGETYRANVGELNNIARAIEDGKNKGQDVSALEGKYEALRQKVSGSADAVVKMAAEGKRMGTTQEQAIKQISSALGITDDKAKKLLETQQLQTGEAKNTAAEVKNIGEAFDEATKLANENMNAQILKLAALKKQRQEAGSDKTELNRIAAEEKAVREQGIKAANDVKNLTNIRKAAEEEIKGKEEKKEKNQKTAFELAKAQLDQSQKLGDQELKRQQLQAESVRLAEGRAKTDADEYNAQKLIVSEMEKQAAAAKNILTVKFSKPGEKDQAQEIANNANNALLEAQNKLRELEVNAELKKEKLIEEARKIKLDSIKMDIELGLLPADAILVELEADLATIQAKILAAKDDEKPALLLKEKDIQKSIRDEKLRGLEAENKITEEKLAKETEAKEKIIRDEKAFADSMIKSAEDAGKFSILTKRDAEMKALEQMRKDELISEEKFTSEKARIEEEYGKKQASLAALMRGQKIIADEAAAKQELEVKAKQLEAEVKFAEAKAALTGKSEDKLAAENMRAKFDDMQKVIDEKGDTLKLVSGELKGALTDTMNDLFAGDTDGMKDNFRQVLGVMAAALQKLVSGFVVKLVMESAMIQSFIASTGFLAPVTTAGVVGLLNAGMGAIFNGIFSNLTSFSTGGIVSEPQLAWVGDRSNTAGGTDNTELILGSDQVQAIIELANRPVLEAFQRIRDDIVGAIMSTRVVGQVSGAELYLIMTAGQSEVERRQRS